MTKKELTTLFILFGGGWLFILGLIASLSAVLQIGGQILNGFRGDLFSNLMISALAVAPVVLYGVLAYLLIRKSAKLAERLLRFGKVDGTEMVQGGAMNGLAPVLFSLLGLYFVINTLPAFVHTAGRWIALEGATPGSTRYLNGDVVEGIARYKSDLFHEGLTLAVAAFVLLRSAWIARQVQKFSDGDRR